MISQQKFLNDVLFTLYAADIIDWHDINRTNFQKILYFCAVLSSLAEIDWDYDFTNANYGPFNKDVHQAVDQLVHYGYAKLTNLILTRNSRLRATYEITDRGRQEVAKISKLQREKDRLNWISIVTKALDIYGPSMVTKLAYKEPSFADVRRRNKSGLIDISPQDNRSLLLMKQLSDELEVYGVQLDTLASKLIAYFDYLSSDIGRGNNK